MQRMRRQRTAAGIAHARCLPCMRTRFCSFLPHFARESGSMFLRGREGELQDPCRCFVPSIAGLAGWLAGAAAALAWPACQTATGEGIVNIVD
jgi:hypothetical protein